MYMYQTKRVLVVQEKGYLERLKCQRINEVIRLCEFRKEVMVIKHH